MAVNSEETLKYHRENNFTRTGLLFPTGNSSNQQIEQLKLIVMQGNAQIVDLVGRAFGNYTLKKNGLTNKTYNWTRDNLDSARFLQAMPYEISAGTRYLLLSVSYSVQVLVTVKTPFLSSFGWWFVADWVIQLLSHSSSSLCICDLSVCLEFMVLLDAMGSFLYPIALCLQLPIYIFLLVLEKKQRLREMMKIHGMKEWQYYLVNYIFFMTLYILSVIFFWLSGFLADFRLFVHTGPDTLVVFFLGWGFSLVSLSFFLSSFVNDPRAATVTGYAVALIGTLTSLAICVFVYGPLPWSLPQAMPQWTYIWPQFSFVRGMYLLNLKCSDDYRCYGHLPSFWDLQGNEISGCILGLYVTGVCYFIFFLYLDAVLPRDYGIAQHPLLCLACDEKKKAHDGEKDNLLEEIDHDDKDVVELRNVVQQQKWAKTPPLVIDGIRKVYDNGKVAVHSLYNVVEKNNCYGLLGENGAGKTTLISMLTGLFPPTRGTALVGEYDITTAIDKVHLVMGLCPQFDVLWDDLTSEEHLLFYARLKGISPSHEDAHVERLLREVGLHTMRDRYSGKLSGGMKRRLSLAISMVGNSQVILLDEPTTGLDPTSRRQIWSIIDRAKKNRAVVLTTHGMDEAESLCDVIGIMAHGRLRCVGSPQHLRSAHGGGYAMDTTFYPDSRDKVVKFVQSLIPTAQIASEFRGVIEFRIQRFDKISIAEVFRIMEQQSLEHGITNFGVSQLSLEAVFQSVVTRYEIQSSDEK